MSTDNRNIALSIVVAAVFIAGAIMFAGSGSNANIAGAPPANNVSVVDGKQFITINAKGGYYPRVTVAKAGLPTVLKMNTRGTFDCSAALAIPSLGYRNMLPPSGEMLIDIPPQKSGTVMRGLCAMGMYSFTVNFN
ncbi:MAG: hypothetical protein Q7R85_03620 [bacterium]|nr:hypothetical protein [bacterium]